MPGMAVEREGVGADGRIDTLGGREAGLVDMVEAVEVTPSVRVDLLIVVPTASSKRACTQ